MTSRRKPVHIQRTAAVIAAVAFAFVLLSWLPGCSDDTTTPDSGDVVNHQTGACVGHFLDCIHRGEQSFLSFANSARVAGLGWAAQMSAARRKPVPLPLDPDDAAQFFAAADTV